MNLQQRSGRPNATAPQFAVQRFIICIFVITRWNERFRVANISDTYVIVRQNTDDHWWDKTAPYNDHTAESEEDTGILWAKINEVCQSRGGNSTVHRDANHHKDDREQWLTSAESKSYNKDALYTRAYESRQFPHVRQAHSVCAEQPVTHHREEVRENHPKYMRRSCQEPGLNKTSGW